MIFKGKIYDNFFFEILVDLILIKIMTEFDVES